MNSENIDITLGGLQRNSLIDYPGHIASVLFLNGCNFRCPYCHNPELVNPHPSKDTQTLSDALAFLSQRRGQIEGVVVSGGEPLMTTALPSLMEKIKEMGFQIKLDTNGSFPQRLGPLIEAGLVDYVAMDIKSAPDQYGRLPGLNCPPAAIHKSIAIIRDASLPHEFRTTCVKPYVDDTQIRALCHSIEGASRLALQTCRPDKVLDNDFFDGTARIPSKIEMQHLREIAAQLLPHVVLR